MYAMGYDIYADINVWLLLLYLYPIQYISNFTLAKIRRACLIKNFEPPIHIFHNTNGGGRPKITRFTSSQMGSARSTADCLTFSTCCSCCRPSRALIARCRLPICICLRVVCFDVVLQKLLLDNYSPSFSSHFFCFSFPISSKNTTQIA